MQKGEKPLKEKELDYWKKISFENQKFIEQIKVKCGICCLSLNKPGNFIIVGVTSGGMLLYDVGSVFRPPVLVAMDLINTNPQSIYVKQIAWGFDNKSQILALYNNGTVSSFLSFGAPANYEKTRRIKKEINPFVSFILKEMIVKIYI